MAKFALIGSFAVSCSAGSAFEAGVQLGNAIAGLSGTDSDAVLDALNAGAARNSAVESVISSANGKASFLAPLNLHIAESARHVTSFLKDGRYLTDSIATYGSQLSGSGASAALVELAKMTAQANAKTAMAASPLAFQLSSLMKHESTSDINRRLAGSLIAFITDMPVATQVSDFDGANGHTNIVMPAPSRVYH
jgi:hypothetical protein